MFVPAAITYEVAYASVDLATNAYYWERQAFRLREGIRCGVYVTIRDVYAKLGKIEKAPSHVISVDDLRQLLTKEVKANVIKKAPSYVISVIFFYCWV